MPRQFGTFYYRTKSQVCRAVRLGETAVWLMPNISLLQAEQGGNATGSWACLGNQIGGISGDFMSHSPHRTLWIVPVPSFPNSVTTGLAGHEVIAGFYEVRVFLIQLLISFLRLPAALLDVSTVLIGAGSVAAGRIFFSKEPSAA